MKILTLNGKQYEIIAPLGWVLEPTDIEAVKNRLSSMNPATCHDVVQGTTQTIILTATGGQGPYTYKLLLDGVQKASFGPTTSTTNTFSVVFSESVGSHTLRGEISDSCSAGVQTASDQCVFSITAPSTTGTITCNPSPTGATVSLDGANIGVVTSIPNVSAGSHTVSYSLSGYNPCSATVTVLAGQTVTAACTLTPVAATVCSWITANGGIHPMPVANISTLIRAYLGYENIGFSSTASYISGAVAYYLGYTASGNSMTGCNLT